MGANTTLLEPPPREERNFEPISHPRRDGNDTCCCCCCCCCRCCCDGEDSSSSSSAATTDEKAKGCPMFHKFSVVLNKAHVLRVQSEQQGIYLRGTVDILCGASSDGGGGARPGTETEMFPRVRSLLIPCTHCKSWERKRRRRRRSQSITYELLPPRACMAGGAMSAARHTKTSSRKKTQATHASIIALPPVSAS